MVLLRSSQSLVYRCPSLVKHQPDSVKREANLVNRDTSLVKREADLVSGDRYSKWIFMEVFTHDVLTQMAPHKL